MHILLLFLFFALLGSSLTNAQSHTLSACNWVMRNEKAMLAVDCISTASEQGYACTFNPSGDGECFDAGHGGSAGANLKANSTGLCTWVTSEDACGVFDTYKPDMHCAWEAGGCMNATASGSASSDGGAERLATVLIIVIVVGATALIVVLALTVFCCCWDRKKPPSLSDSTDMLTASRHTTPYDLL